jgi:hypothetical protein
MTKQENHLDLAFLYSSSVHSHGGGANGTIVLVIADVADRDLETAIETLALLDQGLLPYSQLVVAARIRQDGGGGIMDILVAWRGVVGLVGQLGVDDRQVRKLQDEKGASENLAPWWKSTRLPQAPSNPIGKGRTWYARMGLVGHGDDQQVAPMIEVQGR